MAGTQRGAAIAGSMIGPPIRIGLAALLLAGCAVSRQPAAGGWIGAWGFPPAASTPSPAPGADNSPAPEFEDVTLRQLVRITIASGAVRIRYSNEFGERTLQIGAVHVALTDRDGSIVPGSDHTVTFEGQGSVAIPAHAPALSDPVAWDLPVFSRLSISTYLPAATAAPAHRASQYVSSHGNFTASQSLPGASLLRSGTLVTRLEVRPAQPGRVLVTLGDSITEGFGSSVNEFRGWADRLADRLSRQAGAPHWTVVNAGINSNRLLHDGPGTGALARFDRDVLAVPGLALVMVLEGINDIGYGHMVPADAVGADAIIRAYRQLIERAHSHGVGMIAGTIPPFEGSHYYDARGEAIRQEINRWIRSSGAFDAVVDFDAVLRDPAHPSQVLPDLQRGDHLHPNDSGYLAMADAVDLTLFKRLQDGIGAVR
jgi:lysophospholipase L1-like esterase